MKKKKKKKTSTSTPLIPDICAAKKEVVKQVITTTLAPVVLKVKCHAKAQVDAGRLVTPLYKWREGQWVVIVTAIRSADGILASDR